MYITSKDTIIFEPKYNKLLDINLISQYKKIIFSNYQLSKGICKAYENNIFNNFNFSFSYNRFNQEVNLLLQQLTHLTFGWNFNQEVNMLPQLLTHLTFGTYFNQEVNLFTQTVNTFNFWILF